MTQLINMYMICERRISDKWLQIYIIVLSIIGGTLLPFQSLMSIGFSIFCIVNIFQIVLFSRSKLYGMTGLSVYFLLFDIFGVYNNWPNLQFLAFFR